MTRRQAERELRRMLSRIHTETRRTARREVGAWGRALRLAIAALPAGASTALTAQRAARLMREVNALLVQTEMALHQAASRAIASVGTQIRDEYQGVHAKLLSAEGLPSGGVVAGFQVIPQRVNERLVHLYGRETTLATLISPHITAARDAIEEYVAAATGKTDDRVAVQSIRRILSGRLPVDIGGLDPKTLTPARGLVHRGVRIIGTETFHAMREGAAEGSAQSPLILAARWMLSERHHLLKSSPDKCDDIANAGRRIDDTPGWYEPEEWPVAPHPHCECYQGDVRMIDPQEWAAAIQV